jgi:hypothetical protein
VTCEHAPAPRRDVAATLRLVRRAPGTALLTALLVLAPAAPAAAENGYEAKWTGQSAYLTLESGQRATSYFVRGRAASRDQARAVEDARRAADARERAAGAAGRLR